MTFLDLNLLASTRDYNNALSDTKARSSYWTLLSVQLTWQKQLTCAKCREIFNYTRFNYINRDHT